MELIFVNKFIIKLKVHELALMCQHNRDNGSYLSQEYSHLVGK